MMPPHPVSVSELSRDTGVSDVTLYKWRIAALSGYENSAQLKKSQIQHHRKDKQKIKTVGSHLGGKRGRLISSEKRQMAIQSIATAMFHGARQKQACEIIGITPRTLQYWRVGGVTDQRQTVKKSQPTDSVNRKEKVFWQYVTAKNSGTRHQRK